MAYVKTEELTKRLLDEIVDGVGLYGGRKAIEYINKLGYKYTVVTLKQWSSPVLKVGISLLDLVFPQVKTIPYLGDWLGLWGRDGMSEIPAMLIDKPEFCYASDANTIVCYNFDTTNITLKIDGSSVTPAGVSGTPEELTISLTSPLTAGEHDVLVAGDTKAWRGKVVV